MTAATAYMHPDLIDATQLKHLYGPVVYAAQALELATESVRSLVRSMPALPEAKTRLSHLYAALDAGLR